MPPLTPQRPKVLLFDIGGVCVVSPFQAILDYEKKLGIPPGWVNQAISASGKSGAWSRLERGELVADSTFFPLFQADLTNEARWREYYAKHLAKERKEKLSDAAEETAYNVPPLPQIDAEWMYWDMMRISREADPFMFPALKRLREEADKRGGRLILGALSNTMIFPPGHPFNDPSQKEGLASVQLKGLFDVFVSSAHVGMRKPDEDIYHYAVKQLDDFAKRRGDSSGVAAKDIVFLDDIGTNLRTAKRVGMRTVKVELGRADRAVEELERITGFTLLEGSNRAKL